MSIVHNAYPTEVLLAYFRAILGQLCYYLVWGGAFTIPQRQTYRPSTTSDACDGQ